MNLACKTINSCATSRLYVEYASYEINLWYYNIIIAECKLEAERKEMKKKVEEYLARAEQLKKIVKDLEGR